jgi:hypothetical protein
VANARRDCRLTFTNKGVSNASGLRRLFRGIWRYHPLMSALRKTFIRALTVFGSVLPLLLLTGAQVEAATARTSSTSVCVADMNRAPVHIPMPTPTRLKVTTHLFGFSFTPVEAQFAPRAPARDAWRKFSENKQSTAKYEVFLARFHADNPAGTNTRLKTQNVWVVFAKHVAFLPDPGPQPNSIQPGCEFGSSVIVVNADTGKAVVGAGG